LKRKYEFVNPEAVKVIGSEILELLTEDRSEAELYIACREVARFLEYQGVVLVDDPPQNPLN
jgi:hypothetical protein